MNEAKAGASKNKNETKGVERDEKRKMREGNEKVGERRGGGRERKRTTNSFETHKKIGTRYLINQFDYLLLMEGKG